MPSAGRQSVGASKEFRGGSNTASRGGSDTTTDVAGALAEATVEAAQIFCVVEECCVWFEDTATERDGARVKAAVGTMRPFDEMGEYRGWFDNTATDAAGGGADATVGTALTSGPCWVSYRHEGLDGVVLMSEK